MELGWDVVGRGFWFGLGFAVGLGLVGLGVEVLVAIGVE